METSNTVPAVQTPKPSSQYGRACLACAKGKLRCVPQANGGPKCERCARLNRDCEQPSARKRRSIKGSGVGKVAQLESKLDGLVTLLKAATTQPSSADAGQSAMSPSLHQAQAARKSMVSAPARQDGAQRHRQSSTNKDEIYGPPLYSPGPNTAPLPQPSLPSLPFHAAEPSPIEAEEMLQVFRSHFIQQLPFIVLSDRMTARELRTTQPALYLTIMTVTCTKLSQQLTLGIEVRALLARKIVVEGEKNRDLLLACLTYMTWSVNQFHQRTIPALTSMPMLAMSLVYDLGWNKSTPKEYPFVMLNYTESGCPKSINRIPRTLEDTRALLACYYLTSVSAQYFEKMEPLSWTSVLEEHLQSFLDNVEHPTDVLLALLVRLQLLTQDVPRVPWFRASAQGLNDASWSFISKSLTDRLEDIKNSVPIDLKTNAILLLNLYHAEVSVHEMALTKSPLFSTAIQLRRIKDLHSTLEATQSWFDLFLSIPLASYAQFSFPFYTQMAHCLIVLCRLSIFEDPGWDLTLVRETLDLSLVLDQIASNMSQVEAAAGIDTSDYDGQSIYGQCAKRMLNIKEWWEGRLAQEKLGVDVMQHDLNGAMNQIPVEGVDDGWFMDMLGSFDYPFDAYSGSYAGPSGYVPTSAGFAPS